MAQQYQVLARKWRPQQFDDVVGQQHVTTTLKNAIEQNRLAHAYLFVGPRGIGKTSTARIFAKALNCVKGPTATPCDECDNCKEIAEGRSLDVLEIDGASNNGVEQVRELRDTCRYAPARAKFKIYIIDEVHMLSNAAFNALLKTLEEPPEHVKFMFATTDPEKVLPTILSRCQRFDLRRIPAALIAKHLTQIARLEKVKIAPAALYAIARGATGAMRDAESALDQLIRFCGDKIEEADVLSMFGLTAQGQLLDLARAVLTGEVEKALRQLNDLANRGKDLGRLLSDLLNHFRNLLIFQVSRGDLTMLEISEAEAAALKEQSAMAAADGLTRIMEVLADAEMRIRDAASKKILVEVAVLKAIEARSAVSIDTLLKQLQGLRGGTVSEASHAPAPAPAASPKPSRTAAARVSDAPVQHNTVAAPAAVHEAPGGNPPPVAADDLAGLWTRLLDAVGRASPFTRTYLHDAHPVSFLKSVLTIGFDPEFEDNLGLVDNARNHTLLQTKLTELGHRNAQIKFIKAEAPAKRITPPAEPAALPEPAPTSGVAPKPATGSKAAAAPAPPAKEKPAAVLSNQDDFKNDPLIRKALEIFKGQIVEVRS